MSNILEKINEFNILYTDLKKKEIIEFKQYELEYANAINFLNQIIGELLNTPNLCDENTLKVLKGETNEVSLVDEKYKPLLVLPELLGSLHNKYQEQAKLEISNKNYQAAMTIYEKLFNLTHDYWYLKEIANIFYQIDNNIPQAIKIYEEIRPYMENNAEYWWQYSDLCLKKKNTYRQLVCMWKAVTLEHGKDDE